MSSRRPGAQASRYRWFRGNAAVSCNPPKGHTNISQLESLMKSFPLLPWAILVLIVPTASCGMRTSLLGLAAGDAGLADGTPVHADLLIRTDLPGQRDLRVEPDLAGRPDQSVQADLPFERPSDVRASDTLTDGPSDVAPMKLV